MDTPSETHPSQSSPPASDPQSPQQGTITKLVYGGDGLARLASGEVVMAPYTAPGDEILATPRPGAYPPAQPGKKQRIPKDIQILSKSAQRAEPPCNVFGECGGCQWQHLPYPDQLHWKQVIVEESLTRIGKLSNFTVQPTIGAESPWHYRNKVQWFAQSLHDKTQLGYYRQKSHEVLPFEQCWIIPEPWTPLAHWLESNLPRPNGVEVIQVRSNSEGRLLLTFAGQQIAKTLDEAWVESLRGAFPTLSGIILEHAEEAELLWGEPHLVETINELRFHVSSSSFFQINPVITEKLLTVLADCLPESIDSLLDLYAGVGLFSIALAKRTQRILAVESSESAVEDAQINLEWNQAPNITFETGDVRKVLKALPEDERAYQVAIVDPPRAGCTPDVIEWLAQNITEQVVYISCDPSTLARDLKLFTEQGWRIETVQPFDMFPQTYHIETLVSLKRN